MCPRVNICNRPWAGTPAVPSTVRTQYSPERPSWASCASRMAASTGTKPQVNISLLDSSICFGRGVHRLQHAAAALPHIALLFSALHHFLKRKDDLPVHIVIRSVGQEIDGLRPQPGIGIAQQHL